MEFPVPRVTLGLQGCERGGEVTSGGSCHSSFLPSAANAIPGPHLAEHPQKTPVLVGQGKFGGQCWPGGAEPTGEGLHLSTWCCPSCQCMLTLTTELGLHPKKNEIRVGRCRGRAGSSKGST